MKEFIIRNYLLIVSLLLVTALSCERDDPDKQQPVSIDSLTGYVQKGPFMNGTSINVAELTSGLIQTGKNFNTQISDNRGSFELKQVELSSQFVELKADGFYYNETSGNPSSARLLLYALSNLTDKTSLNVNLISHLEKDRVYHLINEGVSFSEAKQQAQQEVLEIFSIEKPDIQESEALSITSQGDDHAILLAISVILQGYRSVAELSELLANINSDFTEDGILNSSSLGSALINHATLLNSASIRDNLEDRYEETGLEVVLPDFEKYIDMFLENSGYEITSTIGYPEFSPYGENILFGDKTVFIIEQNYSMAADIPVGSKLTIKLSGGIWGYQTMPDGPVNWDVTNYNWEEESQLFTSKESGVSSDLKIIFMGQADSTFTGKGILVEYFENLSDTATRKKIILIENSEI